MASAAVAAQSQLGYDYLRVGRGVARDAAGPQIDALIHGDLHRFFTQQSFLGPISLLVRAPFAALAKLTDGSVLTEYRLGSFPCLVALGMVGVGAGLIAARRGGVFWHGVVLAGVLLFGGPVAHALVGGHPEEAWTTALVLAAAATAALDRAWLAAILLGLAIGSKPWAVLAIAPVALASNDRLRVAAAGTALGVALILPMPLANSSAFQAAAKGAAKIERHYPYNLWFPLAARSGTTPSGRHVTFRDLPGTIDRAARPAIPVVTTLIALWLARGRRFTLEAVLALLALVFLLRCLLDPGAILYYHVPFLAALGCWEVIARRRPPLLALIAGAVLSQRFVWSLPPDPGVVNMFYLGAALPLAGYLAFSLRQPACGR